MPRYIAIDWDDGQIRAIGANVQSGTVTVDSVFSLPNTPNKDTNGPFETPLQEILQQLAADRKNRGAEVIIALRRADVELRLLTLPDAPDAELPDMVRFQSMKEFSELSENWPIDYFPVTVRDEGQLMVAAAAISPDHCQRLCASLEEAGLKAKSLVLRPCAAASLVHHSDAAVVHEGPAAGRAIRSPDDFPLRLMVDVLGTALEVTVLAGDTPAFLRSVRVPATEDGRLPAPLESEIRRTILAARSQLSGDHVDEIILFGSRDEMQSQVDQLAARLSLPVRVLEPFEVVSVRSAKLKLPKDRGRFAALLGALVEVACDERPAIDLLNPRRATPPKSHRTLITGCLLGAACLAVAIGLSGWWRIRSLDAAILQTQRDAQELKPAVAAANQRVKELQSLLQWLKGDIDWLREMGDISARVPPADQAMVRQWRGHVTATDDGLLVLEGVVDAQETIAKLERSLLAEGRRVRGEGARFEQVVPGYPWRFKETVVIETTPPQQAPPTPEDNDADRQGESS